MAKTGTAEIVINEEVLKERMRDLLAQAWDEGYAAGRSDGATNYGWGADIPEANPYRD